MAAGLQLDPLQALQTDAVCTVCRVPLVRGACTLCGIIWQASDRPRERCAVCWTDYEEVELLGRRRNYETDFIGPLPPPSDDKEWMLLPCGHRYCVGCFVKSVEMHTRGEGVKRTFTRRYASLLQCVQCKYAVDEEIVRANVPASLYDAYLSSALRSALAAFGSSVRHCPRPGCEYALVIEEAGDEPYDPQFPTGVLCARALACRSEGCSTHFCASCGELWSGHEEKTCEQIEMEKLTPEERSSRIWKRSNARPCPRCNAATEKNSGCNHMTCSRCGDEWCWLCTKPYSPGHACGVTASDLERLAQRRAQRALERDRDRDRDYDRDRRRERERAAATSASAQELDAELLAYMRDQSRQQYYSHPPLATESARMRRRTIELLRAQRDAEARVRLSLPPPQISDEELAALANIGQPPVQIVAEEITFE